MSINALLAWFGLRAVPHFHNARVHDAMNADAAMIAGMRVVARQSMAVARTMADAPEDAGGITGGVERMLDVMSAMADRKDGLRSALDDIARRLD